MKKALPLAVALLAISAGTAQAITYGQPDGNLHPFVGGLVGTFSSGTSRAAPARSCPTVTS